MQIRTPNRCETAQSFAREWQQRSEPGMLSCRFPKGLKVARKVGRSKCRNRLVVVPMKRILCPVDFSATSHAALLAAERLAAAVNGEIVLLCTTGPADNGEEALAGLKALQEMHISRVKLPGMISDVVVRAGLPGEVICWLAEQRNCDVIVLGTHGRTGISHLLLGSVAEYVIRHARCPVMTVRQHSPGQPPLSEPVTQPVPAPRYM